MKQDDHSCAWCNQWMWDEDPIAIYYQGWWYCSVKCYHAATGK